MNRSAALRTGYLQIGTQQMLTAGSAVAVKLILVTTLRFVYVRKGVSVGSTKGQ
jgi:hypothetical protein